MRTILFDDNFFFVPKRASVRYKLRRLPARSTGTSFMRRTVSRTMQIIPLLKLSRLTTSSSTGRIT